MKRKRSRRHETISLRVAQLVLSMRVKLTSLPLPESLFSLRMLEVLISAAPPLEVMSMRPIPSLRNVMESSLVEAVDDFWGDDAVLVMKGFVLTIGLAC